MTSPTLTKGPPGTVGNSQDRKAQIAHQLAALLVLARRWLASGGRPKR